MCIRDRKDAVLKKGDVLSFYISDEFFDGEPTFGKDFLAGITPSFGVVYEDENIILMEKPQGLLCQGDDSEKGVLRPFPRPRASGAPRRRGIAAAKGCGDKASPKN